MNPRCWRCGRFARLEWWADETGWGFLVLMWQHGDEPHPVWTVR